MDLHDFWPFKQRTLSEMNLIKYIEDINKNIFKISEYVDKLCFQRKIKLEK